MLALLRVAGAVLGRLAYVLGVRKTVTLHNLKRALPELSERSRRRIARRSFANLGIVFFEFIFLRSARQSDIVDGFQIKNLQEGAQALSNVNGVILLGGHIANWEWLAVAFGPVIGRPVNVIVKNQKSSHAEQFLRLMRTRFGNRLIDAGDVRKIFRTLKSGEPVGILGDQTAFAEAVRVPFFGMDVPTFEGTARLALQTRASILFMQPYKRTSHGYECRVQDISFEDLDGVNEENIRILTARHTAVLEAAIREKPEFWLWQHKRFKYV
jgi:KDO2-lipid IV(A) lauroyltransferase